MRNGLRQLKAKGCEGLTLLSRDDHFRKITEREQRNYIGKYSYINIIIKNWNQLPAEALETFLFKPNIFRNRVRTVIINGVKGKE